MLPVFNFWFFKTGFLSVALAVLELPLLTRLTSNSQRSAVSASHVLGLKVCPALPGHQHLLTEGEGISPQPVLQSYLS